MFRFRTSVLALVTLGLMAGVAIAAHPSGTINITWAGVVGNPNPPPPAGKKTVNIQGAYRIDTGTFVKVTYTLYKKNATGGWDPVSGVVDVEATSTPTDPRSGTFTGKKHDVDTGADYMFIVTVFGKPAMGQEEECDTDASIFTVPN